MTPVARLWRWALRNPDRAVLLALAAATLARLAYVSYLGDRLGGPDSNTYDQGGWDLARRGVGSAQVDGLPYFPPGYFLLVAGHYALAGRHPFAVGFTQVVMVAGLTWLTYRLAVRVCRPAAALLTGLGMSASLAWLALPHPLMYEPWLALLLVSTVLLLLFEEGQHRLSLVAGAGALLGLAAVLQDKVLTLIPLVALWRGLHPAEGARRRLVAVAVLAGVSLAVVAPFVIRNRVVYGETIVLGTNHGVNLLIGNNPDADGGFSNPPNPPPWCPKVDIFSADYAGSDRALTACAFRQALAHPAHELRILPNKLARFWATFVGPWSALNNWRHPFDWRHLLPPALRRDGRFQALDRIGSTLWVAASLGLLVTGVVAVARHAGRRPAVLVLLPVAWLLATHLLTFGDPRYRVPVLPLDWLLQAAGLAALAGRLGWLGDPAPAAPAEPAGLAASLTRA